MATTLASRRTRYQHAAHSYRFSASAWKHASRPSSGWCCGPAQTSRRRRRHTARAFSLVELTVVVLVMGILSAVAIPRFADAFRQHCASAAAERIAADLVRAQAAAFGSSSSTTLTFDVAASNYRVANVRSLERSSGTYSVDLKLHPYQAQLVSVWNQTGMQTITFNGYGLPDKGGSIVVRCGDAQKNILVNAQTGTAVVQ